MRITQSRDITPALLTELLAAAGVLGDGAVADATIEMEQSVAAFNDLGCWELL